MSVPRVQARIAALASHFPGDVLDNERLATELGAWTAEKIEAKTGIRRRHLAAPDECASDLAVLAARKLFARGVVQPSEIDYLLFCTQSPDYFLPTTACVLQSRLGLPESAGALDFNLGCSGYIYGLGLAKALIETGQARRVLLLTGDTYSKFLHPHDRSVRTLFGDGAAATLVVGAVGEEALIGPFVYGTDGRGADNLIVRTGGLRAPRVANAPVVEDADGNQRTVNDLVMNGPEIFNFTLKVVPQTVRDLLAASGHAVGDVDHFVFHQANRFMLDHLRKKLGVPAEKFFVGMADCGNTVSSTIPIALEQLDAAGRLKPGQLLMLVGFGVGYSWGGTMLRWAGPSS